MTDKAWPPLPYESWKDTYATLHMWTQVVGKIALAQAPPMNHSWAVSLHLTAHGLATGTLPHGSRYFTIAFDFIDHQLVIETSDGDRRTLPLRPRSVAEFYADVMLTLEEMKLPVKIWSMPVEIPAPIRFSGRQAPPREGPAFMREAYSHEVISHGFWPGSGPVLEPAFYAYAVPEPGGFKTARVQPGGAFYHGELNEFIMPYEAVRTSASPEEAIASFIESTYRAGATLGRWDTASLDRRPA